jgi:hypothetical protein
MPEAMPRAFRPYLVICTRHNCACRTPARMSILYLRELGVYLLQGDVLGTIHDDSIPASFGIFGSDTNPAGGEPVA